MHKQETENMQLTWSQVKLYSHVPLIIDVLDFSEI